MSVLYLRARPFVAFDVNNTEHRKYFAEFVKYNTWGRCPVRFMAESLDTDLVSYINQKMLNYYVAQEFDNAKNKIIAKTKPQSQGTSRVVSNKHTVPSKAGRVKNSLPTQAKA